MERPPVGSAQFEGGTKFTDAFQGSVPTLGSLTVRLSQEITEIQLRNSQWVEGRLDRLRRENRDPLLDVLLVDEEGVWINAISSYTAYANNSHLALSTHDLANYAARAEKFVYPLTGEKDTALFWHESDTSQVLQALEDQRVGVKLEDYHFDWNRNGIRMCRVKRGVIGKGKFADSDIVYGRLGFWENGRLALGQHGSRTLIERARFERSKLLPKTTYVSPLNPEEVMKRGGSLMEVKYPNIDVVRVDPKNTGGDFIIAALHNSQSFQYPLVIGYSTLRPWLGEIPKHGPNNNSR